MLKPIRRVITGFTKEGKSTVLFDGVAENCGENPSWPGSGITLLWKNDGVPTDNTGNEDAAAGACKLMTTPNFIDFMIFHVPPLVTLEKLSPTHRAAAWLPKTTTPDRALRGRHDHPGMHQHDSTDYLAVLAGEVTLILEDGEVTLKAGDTLVNRAPYHVWENRGQSPTTIVSVSVAAKPVGR